MKLTFARILGLAGIIAVLALAAPVIAQDATPEPDAARVSAAKELVKAMDARAQTLASLAQLRQALIMRIQASEPKKAVGFTAYTDKEMDPNGPRVTTFLSDMENIAVQFYARNFTLDEMKAISAFQQSDAGRKFNNLTPELGGLIAARMGKFQSDLIKAVEKGAAASTEGK